MYAGFFYTDHDSQPVEEEVWESTFVVFTEANDPKEAAVNFRAQIMARGEPLICDAIYLDAIIEVRAPAIVGFRSRKTPPENYQAVIANDVVQGDAQAYGWSAEGVTEEGVVEGADEEADAEKTIEPFITLGDWLGVQGVQGTPPTKPHAN